VHIATPLSPAGPRPPYGPGRKKAEKQITCARTGASEGQIPRSARCARSKRSPALDALPRADGVQPRTKKPARKSEKKSEENSSVKCSSSMVNLLPKSGTVLNASPKAKGKHCAQLANEFSCDRRPDSSHRMHCLPRFTRPVLPTRPKKSCSLGD